MSNEELVKHIQAGDDDALLKLWKAVKFFCQKLGKRFLLQWGERAGCELDDLMQAGFIALLRASNLYKEAECSFIGYYAAALRTEFYAAAGMRTERQKNDPLNNCISLDTPISADDPESATLIDFQPDPKSAEDFDRIYDQVFNSQLHEALEQAINKLNDQQQTVIRGKYYEGQNFADMAQEMGVNPQRTAQIHKEALKRIKNSSSAKILQRFIDQDTNFYWKGSIAGFMNGYGSAVEHLAESRERKTEHFLCAIDEKHQ